MINSTGHNFFSRSVAADFADEEPKRELFAARFANPQSEQLLVTFYLIISISCGAVSYTYASNPYIISKMGN